MSIAILVAVVGAAMPGIVSSEESQTGAVATTQLELTPEALNRLQSASHKPLVAELSFDLDMTAAPDRPEGAVRVTVGDGSNSPVSSEDRTVGLISLEGGHDFNKPVRRERTLIELNQALKALNLAEVVRKKSVPITLSVEDLPAGHSNVVAIKNVSVKLRPQ